MQGRGRGAVGRMPAAAGRGWPRGGTPGAAPPRVWRREAAPANGAAQPEDVGVKRAHSRVEEAEAPGGAGAPDESQHAIKRHAGGVEVQAALEAKLREAEELRKQIEERNRRVAAQKAAADAEDARAKAAAEAAAQKEKSRRLAAGFSAAVQRVSNERSTHQGRTAGGASAGPEAARRAGDEAEVARVLGSLTDADVLGLPPRPGADAVKQAYRALAKKLHPDKCTAPRAKDAFQRVLKAYQRLNVDSAAAATAAAAMARA